MSAPTVDAILDQIRALPDDQRDAFGDRLRQSRLVKGFGSFAERMPSAPSRPVETAADLAGIYRDRIPPERVGLTNEQLRDLAERAWGERYARHLADRGGDRAGDDDDGDAA